MTTYGVAVRILDYAGGRQIIEKNTWYRVQRQPIVVIGDLVESHDEPPHRPLPPMVEGEAWYRVGKIPVSREGHKARCGHPTTGRSFYRIGTK